MAKLDLQRTRDFLQQFDFRSLFTEELGWSQASSRKSIPWQKNDAQGSRVMIAELSGVAVFEVTTDGGDIPGVTTCRALADEVSKQHYENLLIFTDDARTQSLWLYVRREGGKAQPREHWYFKGQPGDLFLSKLSSMVVDLGEFDAEGNIEVTKVTRKLKDALDVERVTKRFFGEFYDEHLRFVEMIEGIADRRDQQWYASILLNRLMFIYFLQQKFFLNNGERQYLQRNLADSQRRGQNRYYAEFLKALFFEGFAKPEDERSPAARALLGEIKYLNGGLFLEHRIESKDNNPNIRIPDEAFESLFALFDRYSWNLNDTPGGDDNEISPDVLGYIFEKYINQKAFGAYYTRPEITEYLCEQTIYRLLLNRLADGSLPGQERRFETMGDVLLHLDADLCRKLLQTLRELTVLDPACGSGAFLVAAMKTLINLYAAVFGKIKVLNDTNLSNELKRFEREHANISYGIKKTIITDNLFGVDVMEEATEIAKLRLFLALVASAESGRPEQLEPLPNIDFNIMAGNSLIGLMRVDDAEFDRQKKLFIKPYRELLKEKNHLIEQYRHATAYGEDLRQMRDGIATLKEEATPTLNDLLHEEFKRLKIQFEQATWDDKKNAAGKPQKRKVSLPDIEALRPFHWGYEFDEIINRRGGFDIILTNPPWEIFKPIAKEFCYDHDPGVQRRGTDIKDFEIRLAVILKDPVVREKYLAYLSQFPHLSAYFRVAKQYENQIAVVNGKKAGTDINLYKLFVEECYRLLRPGGDCGIVVPSGIYSDLGAKQLRELLFQQSQITGLFCFENRKIIFENVHRSFKFVALTFEKAGETTEFPAAFMRHEIAELADFPDRTDIRLKVDLIRRLSPDSLSVLEFQNEIDVNIAQKMAVFPLLGQPISDKWNLRLGAEFHMTNDSDLFEQKPAKGRLPLYEGKMIWHFEHGLSDPRYWLSEERAKVRLLSPRLKTIKKMLAETNNYKAFDTSQVELGYGQYRLGFRAVTGATNERALVVSIIPKRVFTGNSLIVSLPFTDVIDGNGWRQVELYTRKELFACASLMASFVCDWFIRKKILTNMNMFYVYEIPVPRLTEQDKEFAPIVERAARLICTTPEFDDLAKEVGLGSHLSSVTDEAERARLRAELDGMIAHLYGLT